jgi:hypothetical protein
MVTLTRFEWLKVGGLTESVDFPDGTTVMACAATEAEAIAAVEEATQAPGILGGRAVDTMMQCECMGACVNLIPGISWLAVAAWKAAQNK